MPLINFIGVGAQKCASSWVHRVLDEHPQTCLSEPKELDYFSYFYGRGHDWYERHFGNPREALAIGDNSPSYFVHPLAPARARRYNPGMKIVVALRDPIERAYSNHLHMVREGFLSGQDLSFERALQRNEMYVEQSRYAKHLRLWLDCFPVTQVHVLLQEDVAESPEREVRRLYGFLGLEADFLASGARERANVSAVPRNPAARESMRRLGRFARRIGLGSGVDALKQIPAMRRLQERGQVPLRDLVPPMANATRAMLRELLADEVEQLRAILRREVLPWKNFELGAAEVMSPRADTADDQPTRSPGAR